MDFKTEKNGNTVTVKMGGPLTIEHAAELKNFMTSVSEESEKIIVDLDDVTDMDLSCIQLLCSANLCFDNTRKRLIRKSAHPKVITQVLFDAGYTAQMVCHGIPCKKCFWKGDEK
ncbi:MAG: STAS domain-containing protein [Desulfobacteraceae bacterium]|nr:STAS domain-containing protein [Desulfobacteraceae bacterium]